MSKQKIRIAPGQLQIPLDLGAKHNVLRQGRSSSAVPFNLINGTLRRSTK